MSGIDRRFFLLGSPLFLAGCASNRGAQPVSLAAPQAGAAMTGRYAAMSDGPFQVPAIPVSRINPMFLRQTVSYAGPEQPGTIVIDTAAHFLYLVEDGGSATRYGVGVGREGFGWAGVADIRNKQEWPKWFPPAEMRLRQPEQVDLIQRRLFTVHFHVYGSADHLSRFGEPRGVEDLDHHRIIAFGGVTGSFLDQMNWLRVAGREARDPREPAFEVNNLAAVRTAAEKGVGLAVLPDYLVGPASSLVQVMTENQSDLPALETYFAYPEEMRSLARVKVFRDFLVAKAQRWAF